MVRLNLANRKSSESNESISSSLGKVVSQLYLLNISICFSLPENIITISQFNYETFKKIISILIRHFTISEFYFDEVTFDEVTSILNFFSDFMQLEKASSMSTDDSSILTFNCLLDVDYFASSTLAKAK